MLTYPDRHHVQCEIDIRADDKRCYHDVYRIALFFMKGLCTSYLKNGLFLLAYGGCFKANGNDRNIAKTDWFS